MTAMSLTTAPTLSPESAKSNLTKSPQRLEVVDALRGFALIAIVLLHNLEHYNLFGSVTWRPEWLVAVDSWLNDAIFFLMAGKAYATFSLLFGFSFFIQMRNARMRGHDRFGRRFAWRMLLLAGFSQFHALFYNGDILLLYAVCGLILIPASRWSDRTVIIIATILMLQPQAWAQIIYASLNPDYVNLKYAIAADEAGRTANIWQMLANNIWNGQLYSNFWQVEAGRICQTPALFLIGMLLGRREMFVDSAGSRRFWRKALTASLCAIIPLYILAFNVPASITSPTILAHYSIAVPMVYNFAFMTILVSAFVLLWFRHRGGMGWQHIPVLYGRMSLTNYIGQSIIGVFVYYHFGLGLYNLCGSSLSLAIGLAILALQLAFSRQWLATHRQGPLEALWKRLTWMPRFGEKKFQQRAPQ